MIIFKSKTAQVLALAAGMLLPMSVMATNGYFGHGYGTANKALGGAGVALPQDALAAATNPAGMVFVGRRFDIGMDVFSPVRGYTTTGNAIAGMDGSQRSENEWFFIPAIAYNHMLDPNNSVGISIYGNGGMNTRYSTPVYDGFSRTRTGVNFAQLFMAFSYAHKLNDRTSVGIAPIFVYQRIAVEGIQGFAAFSSNRNNVSNQGADNAYGGGYRLGGQMDVGGGVTLAASYQSRMRMSKFHLYSGTFAENGDFDIPPTYTLGLAWNATSALTVLLDYQRIEYSDVETVASPMYAFLFPGSGRLGGANGAGFYWQDIDVVKLGLQYELNKEWIVRAGWNHGQQPVVGGTDIDPATGFPVSATQFNIIAPGVITDHLTFGFTKKLASGNVFNMAYMHGIKNAVEGESLFGGGTTKVWMYQNSLEFSYGVKW